VSRRIRSLAGEHGTTPFMVLLAAFSLLLFRYTGRDDILVGSPVAGRTRPELEGLIGCFVNTVVLRVDLGGDPSFLELLARVRDVALEAYAHDDVPFERIVRELGPARDPSHTPVFQVMFVLHHLAPPAPNVRGLDVHNGTAKFDLSLEVVDGADGFGGWFEYDTDLFDAATIARAAGHFATLLDDVLGEPARRLADAALLTETERRELRAWNDTRVDFPGPPCVHQLVDTHAARAPDAVAVVCEDAQLSYGELNARATRLARRLRAAGVAADVPVGICMERSLGLAIALLAVLKAGGAYLPLDPDHPPERLARVLDEARAPVVLVGPTPPAWLADRGARAMTVDANEPPGADVGTDGPGGEVAADGLAYVIYTSGSTGAPKGVMISHRALRNCLLWMQRTYPLTAADRVLHKTPISFDVSIWELLWPLLAGATLVMARPGGHRHGPYLAGLVAERAVTVTHFVPSMLRVFLEQPGLEQTCRSLRHVFSIGEPLTPELVQRCLARLGAALHNLYGPTEAAIQVTAWTCRPTDVDRTVPIGRPIANTRIHLLDPSLRPVPVGHAGELYIGGVAVARGYLGRPELTAERFLPDPFGEPGARLYRTGDLARYRPDGAIEFLGRADRQVKIRGSRVELDEVEWALGQHPGLRAAAVVARPDALGEARLVAYVVAREGPAPDVDRLRAFLRQRLPDYMVPSAFVGLDDLPFAPSGKLDYRALPEPGRSALARDASPPRTPAERLLVGIWQEVLDVETVGVDDNFFDLGGASIQCLRVVVQAGEAGLPMTPEMLFEHQTIAELAAALEGG
jgi:amino acid adenylation domain-containing protein